MVELYGWYDTITVNKPILLFLSCHKTKFPKMFLTTKTMRFSGRVLVHTNVSQWRRRRFFHMDTKGYMML